ncbi:MAG: DnaD domain protein, partial [Defluviitaleaceae bacterium]|nr:DnaD domain protein [Defluviitaleaceae bacterium]
IMTDAATKFITPLTFQSLTKRRVYTEMFDEIVYEDIRHISLAQRADAFVIAPASANIIGKIAGGIADDMLSTVVMATRAPVIIAPAMNTAMYENPIVQANIAKLKQYGYIFIEPKEARLACGDVGRGAMADVAAIFFTIREVLGSSKPGAPKPVVHFEAEQYTLEEARSHLQNPDVEELFHRIESLYGKLLKDSERLMFLSFYDELDMSVELIEFMVEYCLERGKKGAGYVRTVAQNWVEEGIADVETAKAHVGRFNNEYREILRAFGQTGRDPISKEIKYMKRWLTEDKFSMELIRLACEKTILSRANVNFPYADGILNKWKQENIQTVEEIEALEQDYYTNVNSWKRPMKKQTPASNQPKKWQNYTGRKWDYEKLAQMEQEYLDKKAGE